MHSLKTALILVGCCIVATIVFIAMSFRGETDHDQMAARPDPASEHDPDAAVSATLDLESTRVPQQPLAVAVYEGATEPTEPPLELELSKGALNLKYLQSALEDSLYGHIDPNVFLEAALALTEFEVGDEALEQWSIRATRYPLLDMPKGLSGELWVCNPSNQAFGSVRMYALECETPGEQYFLEGAHRSSMMAKIGIWTDADGRVKNFALTTQLEVSGMNVRLGIPLDDVPTGLHYTYDADHPLDPKAHRLGHKDGKFSKLTDILPVVRGAPLSMDDLELLSAGLVSTHNSGN